VIFLLKDHLFNDVTPDVRRYKHCSLAPRRKRYFSGGLLFSEKKCTKIFLNRAGHSAEHKPGPDSEVDMLRRLKQQKGMTAIGWLLTIGLIIAFSIPAMKIIPIYFSDIKVHNALKKLESDLAAQANIITAEKIKKDLLHRFELQNMPEITPDEVMVTQTNDEFIVRITHQYKERIIKDKYFIFNIDKSVTVPIMIKN
jgi:hypothetical protein